MGERVEAPRAGTVRGRAVALPGKREQVEPLPAGTEAARPAAASPPAGARAVAAEPPERVQVEWPGPDLVVMAGPRGRSGLVAPERAVAAEREATAER
jgi:hypothetical protein